MKDKDKTKDQLVNELTELRQQVAELEAAEAERTDELAAMNEQLRQEIAERIQAEARLRESEQYNRMLFVQSPIGLALAHMNGDLVDVNPAYAEIFGHTVEETLELSYWDITPDKYTEQEYQQLDSLTRTGRYGPYEKEYVHRDGHLVPVRIG
jgi:PAS domain S-box-containing protein